MDKKLTERVHLLMGPSELLEIDDWMFNQRIRSRGEAIRKLVHRGLAPVSAEAGEASASEASDSIKQSVPPGPYPWENIERTAIKPLNANVPARLKSQVDYLVRESKNTNKPTTQQDLIAGLLQDYVRRKLPGVPL